MVPINDLARQHEPLLEDLSGLVRSVLQGGRYILGSWLADFESKFAEYCGARHCITVGNGTDALELALRACGVAPNDRVITVANAGGYSTTAILAVGALPKFVDISQRSLLINVDLLADAISSDTRAIIATHLYGRMVNMADVACIAEKVGIPVIEDCAQAHGCRQQGIRSGCWGRIGCFSFYPTKNLGAVGDGGALVTNDTELANTLRRLRQYGWAKKYECVVTGGKNSRMDDLQAAVLGVKLKYLDTWNEQRRRIAARYTAELNDIIAVPKCDGTDYVAHLYPVRTPRRNEMRSFLQHNGIATEVHYPIPDHFQPAYNAQDWARVSLPETERCCREVVSLPCFAELTSWEVERVIESVREWASQ